MSRLSVRVLSVLMSLLALMVVPTALSAQGGKKPDLVVQKLSGLPESAAPGDPLKLNATVKNVGEKKSKGSKLSFSLSEDQDLSDSDLSLGEKNVGAIKPGKKVKVVANLTVPAEAAGTLHVIACATKKSCEAFPNTIVVEVEPDPSFPEAFVGTATATHTESHTGTGTSSPHAGGDPMPSSHTLTTTLRATVTFERVEIDGGYRYDSVGDELAWTVSGNSRGGIYGHPGDPNFTEQCTMSGGSGEPDEPDAELVPIGPFRESRFASGSLTWPASGSLAPGGQYSLTSAYDFVGLVEGDRNREDYTVACTNSEGNGTTGPKGFHPDNWLPKSREDCSPAAFTYTIGPDGSLVGHDTCSESSTTNYPNGNSITFRDASRWDWNLTPVE